MAANDPKFVYAGVTRWGGGGSKAAKPDTLGGVFRMKLGDYRWEHMMTGFPEVVHVHCITVHPKDKNVIFVGTQDGPYRSSDRGEHRGQARPVTVGQQKPASQVVLRDPSPGERHGRDHRRPKDQTPDRHRERQLNEPRGHRAADPIRGPG